ncbi:MAG: hypothetical protein ACXQS3_00595 [Candidatus Methanofastidiosia archaeon]
MEYELLIPFITLAIGLMIGYFSDEYIFVKGLVGKLCKAMAGDRLTNEEIDEIISYIYAYKTVRSERSPGTEG